MEENSYPRHVTFVELMALRKGLCKGFGQILGECVCQCKNKPLHILDMNSFPSSHQDSTHPLGFVIKREILIIKMGHVIELLLFKNERNPITVTFEKITSF